MCRRHPLYSKTFGQGEYFFSLIYNSLHSNRGIYSCIGIRWCWCQCCACACPHSCACACRCSCSCAGPRSSRSHLPSPSHSCSRSTSACQTVWPVSPHPPPWSHCRTFQASQTASQSKPPESQEAEVPQVQGGPIRYRDRGRDRRQGQGQGQGQGPHTAN